MSNEWVTLRKEFYNWLQDEAKTDSRLNIDEIKEAGAKKSVTEYRDKFQEFMENQGTSEEDFTKSTIDLKDEDNKNFLDEIFDDYIDDLKSTSEEFKAIDTDGDKKISSEEKKNFFESIKNLDGKDEDISFKDFSKAIDKFKDENYKFLNKNSNSSSSVSNSSTEISGATQMSGAANTNRNRNTNTNTSPNASTNTGPTSNEAFDFQALAEEKLNQDNYQYTGEQQIDISNINAENIDSQLETAKNNKNYAQETLESTNIGLADLGATYTEAYAGFAELNTQIAELDSSILDQATVIADTQFALDEGISTLTTVLMPAKESIALNLDTNISELGSYQAELSTINSLLQNDSLDKETKAQLQSDRANYQNLVNSTQETIKSLEIELQNCISAIEEQEEYNAEQQSLLIDAHLAYEEMIEKNEALSQETKEQLIQMNTLTVNIALLTSVQANAQADVSNAETQIAFLEYKKAEL